MQLLRAWGGRVYVLGTHRRSSDFQGTMQTPGVPDVLAFLPDRTCFDDARPLGCWRLLVVECKAVGGRLRPEQREFRDLAVGANVDHIVGGLDALIAWGIANGYARADQFAHYRLPAAPAGRV